MWFDTVNTKKLTYALDVRFGSFATDVDVQGEHSNCYDVPMRRRDIVPVRRTLNVVVLELTKGAFGIVLANGSPSPHISVDQSINKTDGAPWRDLQMFKFKQFRAKATEYRDLGNNTAVPSEAREFQKLEHSFTTLADNEQWLADNHDETVRAPELMASRLPRRRSMSCAAWGRTHHEMEHVAYEATKRPLRLRGLDGRSNADGGTQRAGRSLFT